MTENPGDESCASSPKEALNDSIKNRVAASLADARFRPQRTRDKTKEHPRQRKHKAQDVE